MNYSDKIEVIPAIDLLGGKCVRLRQGRYDDCTIYGDDPLETARRFEQYGFRRLHLVDLDGARAQSPQSMKILYKIACGTSLQIEFGGGIKNGKALQEVFDNGAQRAVCGSIAAREPELFSRWLSLYGPERVVLGADVKNRKIAVSGWTEHTEISVETILARFLERGLKYAVITDISRDGMLRGPALPLYRELSRQFPGLKITASGGIGRMEDIQALEEAGIPSVIVGKALYEGTVSLAELARRDEKQ